MKRLETKREKKGKVERKMISYETKLQEIETAN